MPEWLQKLLGGAAGAGLLYSAYSRLGDVGERGMTGMEELAETQLGQAAFRPYTVTTSTGSRFGITQDPQTGELQYGLTVSPEEQAFQQRMFGGAGQFFEGAQVDPALREETLFERIRATQRPDERMERLGLEERLAAQGRLGVRTAQFGGTPEQLAMERAQQDAIARARIAAMELSQSRANATSWIGPTIFRCELSPSNSTPICCYSRNDGGRPTTTSSIVWRRFIW